MGILDWLQQIEKKMKGSFSPRSSLSEPMKIRQMMLDEIEDKIVPVGRGNRLFPFNSITARVFAENDEHRTNLTTFFIEGESLKDHILDRLRQAGCPAPAGLSVQVEIELRTEQATDAPFEIDYQKRKKQEAPSKACLVVLKGAATQESFMINKSTFNIGRSEEVTDKRKQKVIRRNDMVFLESGDESTHTVSRIHAHIEFDAESAEYFLFDDNSERGTRIFREGKTIPVVAGSSRGVRLKSGDEIFLGQVRVRFEIKDQL
ncbi:MAG: FHA domain-containing protein [Acidobacteriota bacterium]